MDDILHQNTGVDSRSLLQGIFPTQVLLSVGGFFTSWATTEAQQFLSVHIQIYPLLKDHN